MFKPFARKLLAAGVLCASAAGAHASFIINLNFSGLTAVQESYFAAAKSFWESEITGYQAGISLTGFTIDAHGAGIDGVGGILGAAGPTAGVSQGGFLLTTAGAMDFDTADIDAMIAGGSFTDVIKHEIAHVIGFGTLWTFNGVYADGTGRYTGAHALAAYRAEFNEPTATFVPVELGGGSGTANGHWDEVDGGAGGASDRFKNELMSGWLNAPNHVSQTTLASFQDIGYTLQLGTVPEPGTIGLVLASLAMLAGANTRRRHPTPAPRPTGCRQTRRR